MQGVRVSSTVTLNRHRGSPWPEEEQREGHIFCKRKCHLKKEAHLGDPDYSQDAEDLIYSNRILNSRESKEKKNGWLMHVNKLHRYLPHYLYKATERGYLTTMHFL